MPFVLLDEKSSKSALNTLMRLYPDAKYYLNFSSPLELLVAAILSAQTRDEVVNAATPALFGRFTSAAEYSNASPEELLKYISRVSFSGNKAKNIISACRILTERFNGKVPRGMDELTSLPGVGRKTANTILINAYGICEGIPVDTWVIKLSHRIGLSRESDPEKIELDLERILEKGAWRKIAYVMKAHGRKICQAQVPLCSICPLSGICPKNSVSKRK